jgi:hypothetical protein
LVLVAMWVAGCGSSTAQPGDACPAGGCTDAVVPEVADVPGDAAREGLVADGQPADVVADTVPEATGDVAAEALPGDAVEATDATDVPATQTRHFTFRAIGGLSMGAQAMTVGTHHPEYFDVIGALGGYVDYRYMGHVVRDHLMGGFCPMAQILANVADINDASNASLNCGPVPKDQLTDYEWFWDFNHFHFNDNGGSWQREFYLDVLGSLTYAFGNMLYYNPDNALLPTGVPFTWMQNQADKCNNPAVVGKPYNYNAEFNPDGQYNLVTFCDGDPAPPAGYTMDTCAADPTCRSHLGDYDPTQTHTHEVHILLAVDYNGNGKRDFGEPVVVNAMERYQDVGVDGCADAFEDGKGGCLATARTDGAVDPNHDNFDLDTNPLGTEKNFEYDPGEPFEDNGLDGVAGTGDYGEGDGQFSINPNYKDLIDQDARTYLMTAPAADLRAKTWYFEGGIRDALHAIASMEHLTTRLAARGEDVKTFDNYAGYPTSMVPAQTDDTLVGTMASVDFSPANVGRNLLMRYGHPDATAAQILLGDGGHVGAGSEVVLRVETFFSLAIQRMPGAAYVDATDQSSPQTLWSSYYSTALDGRRWFVIALPPGYDDHPEARYPIAILLPGIGMPLPSMADTMALIMPMMSAGVLPKFIVLLPDGQCAYRNEADGSRLTGCVKGGPNAVSGFDCVADTCTGAHDTCARTQASGSGMDQECNSGHFFVDHKTNIWGEPGVSGVMKYEDSLFELIDFVDQNYRTKAAGDFVVPASW